MCAIAIIGCGDGVPPPPSGERADAAIDALDGSVPIDGTVALDGAIPSTGPTQLTAVGAFESVALSWDEIAGARSYSVYWSTNPGVTPTNGNRIDVDVLAQVHRGLPDGVEHFYVVTARSAAGETTASPEASATPGGAYEIVQLGSGIIDAVADSGTRFVSMEDRVHVVLLAEGYLSDELDVFRDDIDNWLTELFAIDPYSVFVEAFVIWALPRASLAHVSATAPQAADTAFRVPITSDGRGVDSDVPATGPTAMRVWETIESHPYPPTAFYRASGPTTGIATNLVVHILIFDVDRGRSGLSGRSRRLNNPSDDSQRISTAIAHGRAHEFTHAFARLNDEYLDDGHSGNGQDVTRTGHSAYASNVVDDPSCDTLPWRHLLMGGAINPDVGQLVGAFGNDASGYHSELKCLMNGTHDNAATYGGDGDLRAGDRLCNHCRELTVFRLMERVRMLPDQETSLSTWATDYRTNFYASYGLNIPPEVPQRSSDGTAWFTPCVP